jgi:hypothetical protein
MLLSKVYHRGDDAADQQGIDAHHGQNVLGVSLKLLDAAQPGAARVVVLDVVVEGQEGVLRISCSLDGRRRKVDSCCGDRRFALHVVRHASRPKIRSVVGSIRKIEARACYPKINLSANETQMPT